jgi:hypothetical protein
MGVSNRSSEREPTDSLRVRPDVIGGWLPSLTSAFGDETATEKATRVQVFA